MGKGAPLDSDGSVEADHAAVRSLLDSVETEERLRRARLAREKIIAERGREAKPPRELPGAKPAAASLEGAPKPDAKSPPPRRPPAPGPALAVADGDRIGPVLRRLREARADDGRAPRALEAGTTALLPSAQPESPPPVPSTALVPVSAASATVGEAGIDRPERRAWPYALVGGLGTGVAIGLAAALWLWPDPPDVAPTVEAAGPSAGSSDAGADAAAARLAPPRTATLAAVPRADSGAATSRGGAAVPGVTAASDRAPAADPDLPVRPVTGMEIAALAPAVEPGNPILPGVSARVAFDPVATAQLPDAAEDGPAGLAAAPPERPTVAEAPTLASIGPGSATVGRPVQPTYPPQMPLPALLTAALPADGASEPDAAPAVRLEGPAPVSDTPPVVATLAAPVAAPDAALPAARPGPTGRVGVGPLAAPVTADAAADVSTAPAGLADRIVLRAPSQLAPERLAAVLDDLDLISDAVEVTATTFAPEGAEVAYFFAEDAAAARRVGRTIGAAVRDFTGFAPRPARGTIEVYLSGP